MNSKISSGVQRPGSGVVGHLLTLVNEAYFSPTTHKVCYWKIMVSCTLQGNWSWHVASNVSFSCHISCAKWLNPFTVCHHHHVQSHHLRVNELRKNLRFTLTLLLEKKPGIKPKCVALTKQPKSRNFKWDSATECFIFVFWTEWLTSSLTFSGEFNRILSGFYSFVLRTA